MGKPTANLREWKLSFDYGSPQITGIVTDHTGRPDLRDWMQIRTSRVLSIHFDNAAGTAKAETLNTVYTLSKPL